MDTPNEREHVLNLCRSVTEALCHTLPDRDRVLIKEFFTQLAGPPDCVEVYRLGSTQDNKEISMVAYEAKFNFFVAIDDPKGNVAEEHRWLRRPEDIITPDFKMATPGPLPPKDTIDVEAVYVGLPEGWRELMECVADDQSSYNDEDTSYVVKNGQELLGEYED